VLYVNVVGSAIPVKCDIITQKRWCVSIAEGIFDIKKQRMYRKAKLANSTEMKNWSNQWKARIQDKHEDYNGLKTRMNFVFKGKTVSTPTVDSIPVR
jgi:hypothetical protein